MKVYVVECTRYTESDVIKVFKTEQKAKDFVDQKNKDELDEWIGYTYSEYEAE